MSSSEDFSPDPSGKPRGNSGRLWLSALPARAPHAPPLGPCTPLALGPCTPPPLSSALSRPSATSAALSHQADPLPGGDLPPRLITASPHPGIDKTLPLSHCLSPHTGLLVALKPELLMGQSLLLRARPEWPKGSEPHPHPPPAWQPLCPATPEATDLVYTLQPQHCSPALRPSSCNSRGVLHPPTAGHTSTRNPLSLSAPYSPECSSPPLTLASHVVWLPPSIPGPRTQNTGIRHHQGQVLSAHTAQPRPRDGTDSAGISWKNRTKLGSPGSLSKANIWGSFYRGVFPSPSPSSSRKHSWTTGSGQTICALHSAQAACPALASLCSMQKCCLVLLDTGALAGEPRPVPSSTMKKTGGDRVLACADPLSWASSEPLSLI